MAAAIASKDLIIAPLFPPLPVLAMQTADNSNDANNHHVDANKNYVANPNPETGINHRFPLPPSKKKKCCHKLHLTDLEAVMQFWDKGIYFNIKSGKLRTSCRDLTICNKWDAYMYSRHFKRKCHHDYMNRLRHDHVEKECLKEARDNLFRMHLVAEEQSKLKSLLLYKGGGEPLTLDDTQTNAYYQEKTT